MAKERNTIEVASERAVLAAVRLPDLRDPTSRDSRPGAGDPHSPHDPFGELKALAEQAGATVVGEISQRLEKPVGATFMGAGKLQELKALCDELNASTIIFDNDLSPRQIGNIEKETLRKVVDRSELILDIFASRATTNEAKVQVELAQLEYTYPRLRAMWNHLERIKGGIGSRGPGEMQLEIDRRLVQSRKVALQRELETFQARKRREVAARKREHYTVGIVGYTNAGKSTLFNTLTAGGAYADNRLFATLMTRTREWSLGGSLSVMLSDTVGFVRDIPHHLVASFKATLEEATHADLLLIVLDISDPAAELQYRVVNRVLDELFEDLKQSAHKEDLRVKEPKRVLLLNKVDQLRDNASLLVWQRRVPGSIPISAIGDPLTEPGLVALANLAREGALGDIDTFDVTVPLSDTKTIHLIETRGQVLDRTYHPTSVTLRARIGRRQLAQLRSNGARLELATTNGEAVELELLPHQDQPKGWGNISPSSPLARGGRAGEGLAENR
ncbi:MAG TPA: GTPase HflX [Phycisphaerales bacterium]|nr:GTPase HflX [Phycisphaerales bacterium]